jgi:hypothetical protein
LTGRFVNPLLSDRGENIFALQYSSLATFNNGDVVFQEFLTGNFLTGFANGQ